jgi:hypothetical protein
MPRALLPLRCLRSGSMLPGAGGCDVVSVLHSRPRLAARRSRRVGDGQLVVICELVSSMHLWLMVWGPRTKKKQGSETGDVGCGRVVRSLAGRRCWKAFPMGTGRMLQIDSCLKGPASRTRGRGAAGRLGQLAAADATSTSWHWKPLNPLFHRRPPFNKLNKSRTGSDWQDELGMPSS